MRVKVPDWTAAHGAIIGTNLRDRVPKEKRILSMIKISYFDFCFLGG
jgi:hypothetical protein